MNHSLDAPSTFLPASDAHYAAEERSRSCLQFSGTSDETIGEAVRLALAQASRFLRTLEGVGVLVMPQFCPEAPHRFRVILQITATPGDPVGA